MLLFRYLESLSVSLAKEKRWSEAVHVGRKACRAAEEEAKSLCDDGLRPSAPCIEAQLSSSCLMLAIMLRDGSGLLVLAQMQLLILGFSTPLLRQKNLILMVFILGNIYLK